MPLKSRAGMLCRFLVLVCVLSSARAYRDHHSSHQPQLSGLAHVNTRTYFTIPHQKPVHWSHPLISEGQLLQQGRLLQKPSFFRTPRRSEASLLTRLTHSSAQRPAAVGPFHAPILTRPTTFGRHATNQRPGDLGTTSLHAPKRGKVVHQSADSGEASPECHYNASWLDGVVTVKRQQLPLALPPFIISDYMVVPHSRQFCFKASIRSRGHLPSGIHAFLSTKETRIDIRVTEGEDTVRFCIPPLPVGFGPFTITIAAAGCGRLFRFHHVLSGDVYLCMGQSNMQRSLLEEVRGRDTKQCQAAVHPGAPHRDAQWHQRVQDGSVPIRIVDPVGAYGRKAPWQPLSRNTSSLFFGRSSLCTHFGEDVHLRNTRVPVGLIQIAFNGACITAWLRPQPYAPSAGLQTAPMSEEARRKLHRTIQVYEEAKRTWGLPEPGALRRLVQEVAYSFRVEGFVWYQGEANVYSSGLYAAFLKQLCADVRVLLSSRRLPIVVVVLSSPREPDASGTWAYLRAAQLSALHAVPPPVAVANAYDLGQYQGLHPPCKGDLAYRVSRAMLHLQQRHSTTTCCGPAVLFIASPEAGVVAVQLGEDSDTQPAGLQMVGTQQCPRADPLCCEDHGFSVWHESGQQWVRPLAVKLRPAARGPQVLLSVAASSPTRVRYNFVDNPQCVIRNGQNFSLSPFDLPVPYNPSEPVFSAVPLRY